MFFVPWGLAWILQSRLQLNHAECNDKRTKTSNLTDAQIMMCVPSFGASFTMCEKTVSARKPTNNNAELEEESCQNSRKETFPISIQPLNNLKKKTDLVLNLEARKTFTSKIQGRDHVHDSKQSNTFVSKANIRFDMTTEWAKQQLNQMKVSFDEVDKNKNGELSLEEVIIVLQKHGYNGSKEDAKVIIKYLIL